MEIKTTEKILDELESIFKSIKKEGNFIVLENPIEFYKKKWVAVNDLIIEIKKITYHNIEYNLTIKLLEELLKKLG